MDIKKKLKERREKILSCILWCLFHKHINSALSSLTTFFYSKIHLNMPKLTFFLISFCSLTLILNDGMLSTLFERDVMWRKGNSFQQVLRNIYFYLKVYIREMSFHSYNGYHKAVSFLVFFYFDFQTHSHAYARVSICMQIYL